ncbi:hypothetical protein [Sphingomonas sp.]
MTRFPLTDFLIAALKGEVGTDPIAAAAKYGIRADWAKFYMEETGRG